MARPVTLYTLQWGDLSLETVCQKAKEFGYDGVELGLPDHVDVRRTDTAYYQGIKDLLKKYDLRLYAISTHLVGQAVAIISMSAIRRSCRIIFGEMAIRKGFTNGHRGDDPDRSCGKDAGSRYGCRFYG